VRRKELISAIQGLRGVCALAYGVGGRFDLLEKREQLLVFIA
jgi:hypothetical protein